VLDYNPFKKVIDPGQHFNSLKNLMISKSGKLFEKLLEKNYHTISNANQNEDFHINDKYYNINKLLVMTPLGH
jgi:hypothetical protein